MNISQRISEGRLAGLRTAKGNTVYGKSVATQTVFAIAAFLLLLFSVVLPNSAQSVTACLMIVCFLLSLQMMTVCRPLLRLGYLYLCGVVVTLFYLIVGLYHGAPLIAVRQVIIIYVISPMLWIFIAVGILQVVGIVRLIRWFVLFGVLGCISVALFLGLFLCFGPGAVSIFKEDAVLDIGNGYVAATMFVYGSLIFICGGFFSAPELIGGRTKQAWFLILLAMVALTSGRSALMLSIPIGLALGWLLPSAGATSHRIRESGKRNGGKVAWVFAVGAALGALYIANVDVSHTLELFWKKLLSGGGEARVNQTAALFNATMDAYGAGAGHGVGVYYVRNDEFPWRYEAVWVATVFRVGVIGAFVYLLPFLWYAVRTLRLARAGELLPSQKFMFSGFVCAFLAANTNPYIESFSFQWMYVIPIVSLLAISPIATNLPR